jgi:hypothetical protein
MTSLKNEMSARTFNASDRPAPGAIVKLTVRVGAQESVTYWKEPSDAKAWRRSMYPTFCYSSIDWA